MKMTRQVTPKYYQKNSPKVVKGIKSYIRRKHKKKEYGRDRYKNLRR